MHVNNILKHSESRGVVAAIAAFTTWGFMPLYWWLLKEVPALEVMGNRIVWSFVCLTIYLLYVGRLGSALQIFKHPKSLLLLFFSGAVLAGNWLLYIWAVNNNNVLATSLGYYINPLINIIMGRLFFGDKTTPVAWVAIAFASFGVMYQVYSIGSLPLISLGLGISFAIYGLIRKVVKVEALPGLYVESALLLPVALVLLIWLQYSGISVLFTPGHAQDWTYVILLGPLSIFPLLWFTFAARTIRLTTLGLLQYLGPSIAFCIGVFIAHEDFSLERLVTFVCIWIALALYSWDSVRAYNAKTAKNR